MDLWVEDWIDGRMSGWTTTVMMKTRSFRRHDPAGDVMMAASFRRDVSALAEVCMCPAENRNTLNPSVLVRTAGEHPACSRINETHSDTKSSAPFVC